MDICLLAKEISLIPVILNKKSQQSKGGGSRSKGKVWVLDQKRDLGLYLIMGYYHELFNEISPNQLFL